MKTLHISPLTIALFTFTGLQYQVEAAPLLRITEAMSNGDTADWFELTNYGDSAATITGYQMDDNSYNVANSVALTGVTSIDPGESVVFVEGTATTASVFKTNWSLGAVRKVGYYSGVAVGLSSSGDGVTIFTNNSANGGAELSGPFSGLIRVSFGAATSGTSFSWSYDASGNNTSPANGQLTTSGTTWLNGSTPMQGSPCATSAAPAVSSVSINDVSLIEGNIGSATMAFTVSRSDNTTGFTVDYATTDGTATQPSDYISTAGTLTFTVGGTLSQTVNVIIKGDATFEADESLTVNLSNIANLSGTTTISDTQGIGTILNDEPVIGTPVVSGNRDVLVPNTDTWPAGGITLNGTQFVNLGLQGVGRVPANAIDPVTGESLGSISDMQITGFTKNSDGTFTGTLNALPDRGYNSGTTFSNYAARINAFSFTFTPYTSSTPTTAQNQIALSFSGSTRFTYDHDGDSSTAPVFTTGLLASGSTPLFGTSVPVAAGSTTQGDGTVNNRLTVDSEGLALDTRSGKSGSGWFGDEYGGYIYHFNASKQIDGQLQLPAALVPHSPVGTINFQADPPANGRRINQGMEGLAQSPDGTKLFGLLQSATIQDSGSGNQGRSNARLLIYDVSSSDVPNDPVAQYLIQLPRVDDTGSTTNGNTVNRNAAQSAILALNDHQILILSRDGNGRGAAGTPVFKSILLADLSNATNIDGLYDAEGNAIAPGGVLAPAVTPVSWSQALNLLGKLDLNIAEVAKFGLNLSTAPGDINTLCEKWEALSLVPCGDSSNPQDFFLFVGNDNDFISATGKYLDASGTLRSYNSGLENDTLVLAYRVRIVPPATPIQTWRQSKFGTLSTAGDLADAADYDHDGVTNLIEYALGSDPSDRTSGPSLVPTAATTETDSLLSDRLSLSFRLKSPNPADLTYLVQTTDDLSTWTPVASKAGSGAWTWLGGGSPHLVTSGTDPVTVKVGDLVPLSGNPKRLMRLKVTNP